MQTRTDKKRRRCPHCHAVLDSYMWGTRVVCPECGRCYVVCKVRIVND